MRQEKEFVCLILSRSFDMHSYEKNNKVTKTELYAVLRMMLVIEREIV